jgi:putative transcriptional regulator
VKLRKEAGVSQAMFAAHLNVTTGTVSQWERGEKTPSGPSLKLLNLVENKGLDAVA